MPGEDALRRLEARLTRLEAALAQSGGRPQPIVDPAVFAGRGDLASVGIKMKPLRKRFDFNSHAGSPESLEPIVSHLWD